MVQLNMVQMKMAQMNFENKKVLITGASAGIGYEFAMQFHEAGADLILVARRADTLNELRKMLETIRANSVKVIACDLGHPESLEFQALLDYIQNNTIDILVNNAGHGSFGQFENLGLEQELSQIRLNIEASTRLAHKVIPQMKRRKSGSIISVASIAGMQALPFMATYSGTKAFNLFQAQALWYELKPFGIHVMALCPGPVKTEFGEVAKVPGSPSGATKMTAEEVVKIALKDLARKHFLCVPGYKMKMIAIMIKLMPKLIVTNIIGRLLLPLAIASKK